MLATFAFDVCHEVYRAAREAQEGKIATLNLESSGKYTWRPDRVARLAEFVADFARAGERALGGREIVRFACLPDRRAQNGNAKQMSAADPQQTEKRPSEDTTKESLGRFVRDESQDRKEIPRCARNDNQIPSASRLAMFRMFYLGGAEYHAARRHLGISEFTWADWSDEIRARVGRELVHGGMFPPSKYFAPTGAREAPRTAKRDLRATGT